MGRGSVRLVATLVSLALGACATAHRTPQAAPPDGARMPKESLKARLGDPNVVVIDVRREDEWAETRHKISGAHHESFSGVASWAGNYPKTKEIVLYCA